MARHWKDIPNERRDECAAAMCDGKDKLTHSQAKRISRRMRKRTGAPVSPYRCVKCHEWHVGATPRR